MKAQTVNLSFFRSMRGKLLFWFLLLSLVPLIVITTLAYIQAQNALRQAAYNQLTAVNELKRDEINQLFEKWKADILDVSTDPDVVKGIADLSAGFKTLGAAQVQSLYSGQNKAGLNDGSAYSTTHDPLHEFFRGYAKIHGYDDIFLIDPDGNVVYSIRKSETFGANLTESAEESNLAGLFKQLQLTPAGQSHVADAGLFENQVALFIGALIYGNGNYLGALVYQLPIQQIDTIMQERAGMGQTGETYLVGPDKRMRSNSFLEPVSHSVQASFAGTVETNGVDTEASRLALAGQSGTSLILDYRSQPVLSAYAPVNVAELQWVILTEIDEVEAFAAVNNLRNAMLVITALAAVGVIGIALWVASSLARPVVKITEMARAVADGDLTQSITVKSRDELGDMALSFQQMTLNLRTLIGQIVDTAATVSGASGQLASAAEQAGQASQQVASTIQQIAQGTTQQTNTVTQATNNIEQVAHAAEGIARGAQEQAAGVQKTSILTGEMAGIVDQVGQGARSVSQANAKVAQAARAGVAAVGQTSQGMDTIRSRSLTAADKVKEMGLRSKEIGRIVETIDDIADKTDMLALNAAVEAARAGEHGRGFAVVAEQVRKLSEDSKNATRDIAELIERVQETIRDATGAMENTVTEVGNGTRLAGETTRSLEEILQAAEEAAELAEQITGAVAELKRKSEGMVTAMEGVSAVVEENTAVAEEMAASTREVMEAMEGVASVAEENSAASEEVSASAEEMSAQVEEVVASAQELSVLAEQLQAAVAQFRLEETSSALYERPAQSPARSGQKIDRRPAERTPVLAGHNGQDRTAR